MRLDDIVIVLVRPTRAANVAAACRAMKNMGLSRLRIVTPCGDLGDPGARALAYGAWDVLDAAERVESLGEAIRDATLVAATSGRDEADVWSPKRLAAESASAAAGGSLAVVFGPEASGLTAAERRLCHLVVRIPSAPAHPSLNLAQAVLVLAYELFQAARPEAPPEPPARARAGELEEALTELRSGLVGIGYLNAANPDPIHGELRRLLARAAPTPREVALLRGLARQIRWAAGEIARARGGGR